MKIYNKTFEKFNCNKYGLDISVILCTFNNCKRLSITLDELINIEVPDSIKWELIIVNNNSQDETRKTVLSCVEKLPVRYVEESNQGLSYARNAGLLEATGELIVFTDDDIKPCVEWLQTYWEAYLKQPCGRFWGGSVVSDFEIPPTDLELISLAPFSVKGLSYGNNKRELVGGEYFVSANWAVPLEELKKVGGFDSELGLNPTSRKVLVGEETDLMRRLVEKGLKGVYLPKAKIKHFVPKEKMSLQHIASRYEALGRCEVFCMPQALRAKRRKFIINRFFKLIFLLIKTGIKRVLFRDWYRNYLQYRKLLGGLKEQTSR